MNSLSALNELLVGNNCVHVVSIHFREEDGAYDLTLSLSPSEQAEDEIVRVRFIDISHLNIRDFGGGLTQLMHMNVRKLESGFDRERYQLSELEDDMLSFCFSSFLAE